MSVAVGSCSWSPRATRRQLPHVAILYVLSRATPRRAVSRACARIGPCWLATRAGAPSALPSRHRQYAPGKSR
eukprot:1207314-Prymnesium_polylepis.1